jgi:hypothetical protein
MVNIDAVEWTERWPIKEFKLKPFISLSRYGHLVTDLLSNLHSFSVWCTSALVNLW